MTTAGKWRLLDTGRAAGAFNMAADAALLEFVVARESPPVLRLYGWHPAAVSLGYSQVITEIDAVACAEAGVDAVRRPTGGRAVYHVSELTYSVVCRRDDALLGGSVTHTYRVIGQCLVAGLRAFGLSVELERSPSAGVRSRTAGVGTAAHGVCFASTSRWEVKCRGRKLVGSAQRRLGEGILQHGSLPIGPEYRESPRFLRSPSTAAVAEELEANSICLEECVDGPVDVAQLRRCLGRGFGEHLEVEMVPSSLAPAELRKVRARQFLYEIPTHAAAASLEVAEPEMPLAATVS